MRHVQIGDRERPIGDFSAYKAFAAMEILTNIEDTVKEIVQARGEWKRQYESDHFSVMDRAEARRYFAPQPLTRMVPLERDGEIVYEDDEIVAVREPVLDDQGAPILGPDPLGHLTEEDWAGSDHTLRVPESPSKGLENAATFQLAFKLARDQTLMLIALALTPNRELEEWENDDKVLEAELQTFGGRLLHEAQIDQIAEAALAVIEEGQEQLSGPLDRITAAIRRRRQTPEPTATEPPPPMRVEEDPPPESQAGDSVERPTSSTASPADTPAGTDGPSSTEPASDSSLSSSPA